MRNYSNKKGFNDPSKKSMDLDALKHSYFSSTEDAIVAPHSRPLKEVIHEWVDQRVDQKLQEYFKDENKIEESIETRNPICVKHRNDDHIKKDTYTIPSGHFKISWQKFSSTDQFACTHVSISYVEDDEEIITGYIRIDGSEIAFHNSVKELLTSSLQSMILENPSDFCRGLIKLTEEAFTLRLLKYERYFLRRNEIIRIPLGENYGMLYNRTKDVAAFVDDWKKSYEKLPGLLEG